jgi:hypothetical protein
VSTIYQRLLQERFELLTPVLRRFLGAPGAVRASGRLTVTRAPGRLRNLVASALGIPPAGAFDLLLDVSPHAVGQRWKRRFGSGHELQTDQADYRGLLVESSGPASLGFELIVEGGALLFRPRRAWLLGLPLPLWLAPGVEADNRPAGPGSWRVCVRFRVPLLGRVAEYEGDVIPEGQSPPDRDAAPGGVP